MPSRPQEDFLSRTIELAQNRWGLEINEDTAQQWARNVCDYVEILTTISRLSDMDEPEPETGGEVGWGVSVDGVLLTEEVKSVA